MFQKLESIEQMNEKINTNVFNFFYITQPNCSVCHGLFPQIESILKAYPEIHCYEIDASETPDITGNYQVFTAPTLLLFVDGKEYIREARFVQTKMFQEKIDQIYNGRLEM